MNKIETTDRYAIDLINSDFIKTTEKFVKERNISFFYDFINQNIDKIMKYKMVKLDNNKYMINYNFINMVYDVLFNENLVDFSTPFYMSIETLIENPQHISNREDYQEILKTHFLIDSSGKPTIVCRNIYNIFLSKNKESEEQKRKHFSEHKYINIMKNLRIPKMYEYIEDKEHATHLLSYGYIQEIVRPEGKYFILSRRGQKYLYSTRKIKKYGISAFVYEIFEH